MEGAPDDTPAPKKRTCNAAALSGLEDPFDEEVVPEPAPSGSGANSQRDLEEAAQRKGTSRTGASPPDEAGSSPASSPDAMKDLNDALARVEQAKA